MRELTHSVKYLLLFVPVVLCGCAHGFDRDALRERLNDGTLQSPDAAIAEARNLRPQLRFPCRIAVYLKPPHTSDWRWTQEDKAAMQQWATKLREDGIASDVFPLPELLTKEASMKELRLAAAQCGADALFVIHGAAQTDSYKNFAAILDFTVVGGFVVPGSQKDTLFLMEGLLLDVDNGYIYTGVQAEGVGKIVQPSFVIKERDSILRAKTNAVEQFGKELLSRMRTLASISPTGRLDRPSDVPAIKPTPNALRTPRDTRLTPQNAGGVMTGITAPTPAP